jgi:hypothetical protein
MNGMWILILIYGLFKIPKTTIILKALLSIFKPLFKKKNCDIFYVL